MEIMNGGFQLYSKGIYYHLYPDKEKGWIITIGPQLDDQFIQLIGKELNKIQREGKGRKPKYRKYKQP